MAYGAESGCGLLVPSIIPWVGEAGSTGMVTTPILGMGMEKEEFSVSST